MKKRETKVRFIDMKKFFVRRYRVYIASEAEYYARFRNISFFDTACWFQIYCYQLYELDNFDVSVSKNTLR